MNSDHWDITLDTHPLLRIEHQAPNLDGLPRRRVLRAGRVQECSVRGQPGPVRFRIETLDQRNLVRRLVGQVVPTQLGVILDGECASDSIRVNEAHRDEVMLDVECSPVRDSERFVRDGMPDGTPNVDNANAGLEKTLCFVFQVMMHALHARLKGLVDMHALLRRC